MIETKKRSLAKALTWRVISINLGIIISLFFVTDWDLVLRMNLWFVIVGTVALYMHERVWNKVEWGREKSNAERKLYFPLAKNSKFILNPDHPRAIIRSKATPPSGNSEESQKAP